MERKNEERMYEVSYIIKSNCQQTTHTRMVKAANAHSACQLVKQEVKRETGRNAFTPVAKRVDKERDNGNG